MIMEESKLVVADNTGAKIAKCFRVLGQRKRTAGVGDIIRVSIQEATPTGAVKKGQVCFALIVRTAQPLARPDGSFVRFDQNAASSLTLSTTRSGRAFSDLLHANCVTKAR